MSIVKKPQPTPHWASNKRVQSRTGHLIERENEIKKVAQKDLELTRLLHQADQPGFLEPEGPLERTTFYSQERLRSNVSLQAANKMFSLELDGGSYSTDYTRNGRFLLLGGDQGHFASFDWQAGRMACEINLADTDPQERIADVCYLQNETMLAVAQTNYVYIYDGRGIELHRLKKHSRVRAIEYLPYHFLLSSVSEDGWIRWQDVSMGTLAAEWKFAEGYGRCSSAAQNPATAVMHCGHANGVVSLWSPILNKPLVRINCHKGPIRSLAVNGTGQAMATAGLDGTVRIWDLRSTYHSLGVYRSMKPAVSVDFSQSDLLGVAYGAHVAVWKDVLSSHQDHPYMTHVTEKQQIRQISFCPYEDALGIGHSGGFSSVLIPGSGEPNYDIYEANPFATRKQRQEREVHALLDKLPADTITLDGGQFIGRVVKESAEAVAEDRKRQNEANNVKEAKNKARGRSSALSRYLKKRANVIDKYKIEDAEKAKAEVLSKNLGHENGQSGLSALNRFVSKAI